MRGISLVLIGLLAATSMAAASPQASSRAELFRAVLQFQARDLRGKTWNHEELKGRIVLLDFWATWCAPCLRELPYLKQARETHGESFEILGISLDTMDRPALRHWLDRQGVDWPQIHASGGYRDQLARAFGIDRLPTNLLLDRAGRLRALNLRRGDLLLEIDRLLDEERRPH